MADDEDPTSSPYHGRMTWFEERCVPDSPRLRTNESILESASVRFGCFWMIRSDDEIRMDVVDLWSAVLKSGGAIAVRPTAGPQEIEAAVSIVIDKVESGEGHMLLMYWNGRLAGCLSLAGPMGEFPSNYGVVSRVMVHPEFQRRGLGTAMLAIAAEHARAIGLRNLVLSVRDGTHLDGFYARRGWVEVGRWRGGMSLDESTLCDEIWMQRYV